jgi:hypothetical protein
MNVQKTATFCGIKFAVCWQAWRDFKEEIAVAMNKGCHDVGLRKQHLGYCTVLNLAVLTDGRWKLAAHTITPLDVTTVARCCGQTQYVLHITECHQKHCKHHSDSGQQVASLPDIA